ncbi:hypothetical protein CYMTET_54458 [Cymbomonas tetramitiformis]|uniref:CSD domain-containing protein n=1 Tax=Cymbomonas tetramitiformis TaxID=36881 RepID=A0AAE0BG26_9CHLO|nr:hypothetical protein CYMTET_54458 [Cymbomonas tetramitiformis]
MEATQDNVKPGGERSEVGKNDVSESKRTTPNAQPRKRPAAKKGGEGGKGKGGGMGGVWATFGGRHFAGRKEGRGAGKGEDRGAGRAHDPAAGAREAGIIACLRDSFGFIRCAGREARLFFHFTGIEGCLERELFVGAEVGFTVEQDQRSGRPTAAQVQLLPKGSVKLDPRNLKVAERVRGVVEQRPAATPDQPEGIITYDAKQQGDSHVEEENENSTTPSPAASTVPFLLSGAVKGSEPNFQVGSEVIFDLVKERGSAALRAVNIHQRELGVVCMLKPTFGFIKCCERTDDMFFHLTAVEVSTPQTQTSCSAEKFSVVLHTKGLVTI